MDGEKVTETKVTNAIYTHPEYISRKSKLAELQDKFSEADQQARLLEVGRDTMNQRKEMLISLGAQLRNDYDGVADCTIKGTEESTITDIRSIVGKNKAKRKVARQPAISESEE